MRDIFLVVAVLVGLGFTLRFPFVGILLWVWFSIMSPHEEAFGFSQTLPLNFAIAAVTMVSWLFSKEPKRFPVHLVTILLLLFLAWTTFNSFFAYAPDFSWPYWDRVWRIFALGFMISCLATNKIRIEAILWCAAISLMYYGVKGGIFTIATGGSYRVYGPSSTIIGDNNQLALALLMVLPMMEYLRSTVASNLLSKGLLACMALIGVSILGSYSRGAYIGMAVLAVIAVAQSKRKVIYFLAIASFAIAALWLMPQSFYDRVDTIGSVNSDASFQGRWMAWQVATRYAWDHFPFGAGFYAPQLRPIFSYYFPGEPIHAAHSIYFQVLGEHGFIGLILYVGILIAAAQSFRRLARLKLQNTDADWIHRLSQLCFSSIIAFGVGGAALSMAYYDLFIIVICLIPPLTLIAEAAIAKKRSDESAAVAQNLQTDLSHGENNLRGNSPSPL
jgi:putative inorganic carbon (hco3(-)) transporter